MRSPFFRASLAPCLLLGFGLAACKGGSERDAEDALRDEELPEECAPGQEEALRRKIQDSVRKIRIAQSNADLRMMNDNERTLDALDACGEVFYRFCDAECAAQRASVYLFTAAALPLLSSKGTPATDAQQRPVTEGTQLEAATTGIRLVEKALEKLPRQRGFAAAQDATDSAQVGGFRQYVKSYARLQALHAELEMVAGDVYYRSVSTSRSNAISFVASEVLGDTAGPGEKKPGNDLARALEYYERAHWTLLDAQTAAPTELGNSPLYGPELNKLHDLTQQVGERLRSAREGKLYIGVDPSGLQDGARPSAASLTELMAQLEKGRVALQGVEGELGDSMAQWAAKSQELAQIGDQTAELQNSRAIDLSVHKMNQVRERAEARAEPIEDAIRARELTGNQFELEAQIEAARLRLEISKRQLENDLAALEAKTQEDILDRKVEGTRHDLDVVRNAIDSTLADYNFDMQLAALAQQQLDLGHSKQYEGQNLLALQAQFKQADEDINVQRAQLQDLRLEIQSLRLRRDEVVRYQTEALQRQVDAMDVDIAFFAKAKPEFIQALCSAHEKIGNDTVAAIDAQIACLRGSSCGPGSLTEIYDQLLAQKRARHANVVAEVNKSRELILARINQARAQLDRFNSVADDRKGDLLVEMGAMMVAGALPTISTEIGFPPSVSLSIDPLRIVQPSVDYARQRFEIAAQKLQFGYGVDAELAQARERLAEAALRLSTEPIEQTIDEIETRQALAELHVRLLGAEQERVVAAGQLRTSTIDCQGKGDQAKADLSRAQAERAALHAQLGVQAGERSILDVQLQQQDARIAQVEATIRRLAAQKEELDVRVQQATAAVAHFARMEGEVVKQVEAVRGYRTRVHDLATRRDELQNQLFKHIEEVALVRLDADQTQRTFIMSALRGEEKVASQTIDRLHKELAMNAELQRLTEQLAAINTEANAQLQKHRAEIMTTLDQRPLPQAAQVIWDFEDLSSRLTRGASELLEYKRSILNSFNFYYNAYRYRYNMLSELAGIAPIKDRTPYIWTATDALNRLADCADFGTTPLCHPSSLANNGADLAFNAVTFAIPANSPMYQELLRTRRTRFEFSEYAGDKERSAQLGSFVLWDALNMRGDMRVIGFYLGFPDLTTCNPATTYIRHTGLGFQEDQIVMRAPLAARPTIYSAQTNPDVSAAIRARVDSWTPQASTIMQLERRLAAGDDGPMHFLGYPLRGVYEITTTSPLACLQKATQMLLTVVFASR